MTDNTQSNSALDSLLDETLDDLADLPGFKAWPAGTHLFSLSLVAKEINKKPAVEAVMIYQGTKEFAGAPEEKDIPKVGDKTSVLYLLSNNDGSKNEINQGLLKNVLSSIREQLQVPSDTKNGELVKMLTQMPLNVEGVTGVRMNKQTQIGQTTLGMFKLV
jgi:hypothetical protein